MFYLGCKRNRVRLTHHLVRKQQSLMLAGGMPCLIIFVICFFTVWSFFACLFDLVLSVFRHDYEVVLSLSAPGWSQRGLFRRWCSVKLFMFSRKSQGLADWQLSGLLFFLSLQIYRKYIRSSIALFSYWICICVYNNIGTKKDYLKCWKEIIREIGLIYKSRNSINNC